MRRPTSPGEFLKEDYMDPLGYTISYVSKEADIEEQIIKDILANKKVISYEVARKLAIFLKMDPEFWIAAQDKYFSQI